MPMSEEILVTRQGAVLEIRMNRPAKKNALTKAMYGAMADALEAGDRDADVRAILISAEGDMFTAGNDLSDFAAIAQGAPPAGDGPLVNRFLSALAALEKPLIAAVTGHGVGVGATMLLHCDIAIIAEDAQLSMPFTSLGLTPEAASSLLLPAQIGHKRAFMMLALGQPLGARDAVSLGIASEAAPREEVGPRAMTAAQACCDRPPEAMRITKRLLRDKEQIRARLDIETEYFRDRLRSPEAKAAFEAFFKR
jgi:enoyl-CoA hydratase/carnithine racemase